MAAFHPVQQKYISFLHGGLSPAVTPAEFAATIKADMTKWGRLIKDSGMRE